MNSEDTPHVITVQETQTHAVAAGDADLHVTVEGLSLFTGAEALKKAREVAQLVSDLTAAGLPQDAIFLQGVSADVQSGTLSKNSRAKYRLRVHCADLSQLADFIGVIASQKNAALTAVEWGYPDDDALHDDWLLACVARVRAKSAKIAAALGVQLTGVHSFSEDVEDSEMGRRTLSDAPAGMRRRMASEDLGLEVSHTKTVFVSVTTEFLVSGYDAP